MGGWMVDGERGGTWEEVGKGDRSVTRSQPRLEAGWRWVKEEVNERGMHVHQRTEQLRGAELSSPPQPCGRLRGIGRSAAAWVREGGPYLLSSIFYLLSHLAWVWSRIHHQLGRFVCLLVYQPHTPHQEVQCSNDRTG